MNYDCLFETIKIGTMEVKNRFAVPAMDTKYVNFDGFVTEQFTNYWVARAKGGFGLIITECTAVDPRGIGGHLLQIWDDKYIPGLTEFVEKIHKEGAKIVPQLYHAGRQTSPALIGGEAPVAPTAIPCTLNKSLPRELDTEEVYEIIEKFVDGAVRAKKAGFDGVQIHGGHGYIVSEFMSTYYNKRFDEFGGSFNARMNFPVKIVQGIKEKCGKDFPIIFRLSSDEMCPGGRTIEETKMVCKVLEEAGVDAIDVSVANYYSFEYNVAGSTCAPGWNLKNAEEIKKVVSIPVIGVNRINDPAICCDAIANGKADMVALGRASIADPEFPNKVKEGRADEISPCCACNEGCVGHIFHPDPEMKVNCAINPFTGREGELVISPCEEKKNVIVVGAGPAGLETAWIAAKRGHNVTVYEKEKHVGGQYRVAAVPPFKYGIAGHVKFLLTMNKKYGVKMKLNTAFTPDMVGGDDVVVLATGATPAVPPIKNIENVPYVQAIDLLDGKTMAGTNVLVIGGGLVGAETADFLGEHGCNVTIIDMLPEIGMNMQHATGIFLKQRFAQYRVNEITNAVVLEMHEDGITYRQNDEVKEIRGFDTIVIASGSKSYNPLEQELEGRVKELYVIGDANKVGLAIDATEAAARLAVNL